MAGLEFTPLSKYQGPRTVDVIVIGSGMGGMACSAALAKSGRKVLLLEQHYTAGGYTHTFSRKGYTWDVGVHCLGEMSERELPARLLSWISDDAVKMERIGKTYESFFFPDEFHVEFPSTRAEFQKELETAFPEDKESIAHYFVAVREAVRSVKPFFVSRAFSPWASKLEAWIRKRREHDYWTQTTAEVLDKIVPNPKLKAVLTAQWGYCGSSPRHSCFAIHALIVRHYWNGGYYPVGGSKTIATGIGKVIRTHGGELLVRAPVEEILIRKKKAVGVRMADGQEFLAEKVISAAGARTTTQSLLPKALQTSHWAKEVQKIKQSPAFVCLYLGFKGDILSAGASRANQWFFETWNMDESTEWDIDDPKSVAPAIYVSFPSLKDPHHEPGSETRHTAEVVTFVPWAAFEKWKETRRGFRNREYLDFKKDLERRLLDQVKRHLPELVKLLDYCELSTPLSALHFARSPQGAIYGLEATPHRFNSPHLTAHTPIRNLYLAGGDVASLGVIGAMMGGFLTACALEPKLFLKLV